MRRRECPEHGVTIMTSGSSDGVTYQCCECDAEPVMIEYVPASQLQGAVKALERIERIYERTMPGPKDAQRDRVLEVIAAYRQGGQ